MVTTSKLDWCNSKNSYEFVKPNLNIGESYIEEALDTLQAITVTQGKWRVIMAYYACYHALYALVIKEGIKCENHECTLALMELLPAFSTKEKQMMLKLKEDRIQNQYYLQDRKINDLSEVKQFITKCRSLMGENLNLTEKVKNGKK